MKFAFLKSKVSIVIITLVLGMVVGFKVANNQYRHEQGTSLRQAVAQASGQMAGSASVNSSSSQNLSPEERNRIINEVRAIIDKAKNNPQDVEAQLDAADQFIQIGRPEEAIQFLEQANKVKPNDARTTAEMGMAKFMMGEYDEAITWSKRSLGLAPKNPGASFLLIASYIRSNQNLDEAERLIKQLESEGVDPEMIARAREELNTVRSGITGGSGAKPNSQTMLNHGPEDQKGGQGANKTGGRR